MTELFPVDTVAIMAARQVADHVTKGKKRLTRSEIMTLVAGFLACDRQRAAAMVELFDARKETE